MASIPQRTELVAAAEDAAGDMPSFANGALVWRSRRCPTRPRANQDSAVAIAVNGTRGVFAVADGMGGMAGGDRASAIAVESLRDAIEDMPSDKDALRVAVMDGIERANERVMQLGIGAGSTIAAVEVDNGAVRPYHVGDSMILVIGQRGARRLITVAHGPVAYAVEAGMLSEDEAMHHAERHLISNMVGSATMRIDVGPIVQLQQRDTVLLGSDGLFDNLHLREVIEIIRKGPLQEAADALIEQASVRMAERATPHAPSKPDDITFMLFRQG
ncbi:MAG: PP2C family protein-serine/threonine phosphatase [Phycisphaerales bacterium]